MLTLTENAVKKVKEFYDADQSIQGKPLRVFVEKGGCSGFQYGFSFDDKKDGDVELPVTELKVIVVRCQIINLRLPPRHRGPRVPNLMKSFHDSPGTHGPFTFLGGVTIFT